MITMAAMLMIPCPTRNLRPSQRSALNRGLSDQLKGV
jgi:hypothetical protein